MIRKGLLFGLVLTMIIQSMMVTSFASIENERITSANKALKYLMSVQNSDGGFPIKEGMESSVIMTSWATMAISAGGENATGLKWTKGGQTPIDFLKESNEEIDSSVNYARLLLALSSSKSDLTYKGNNMLEKVLSTQQGNGAFYRPEWGEKGMIYAHMWSILAIASTGEPIPNKAKAKAYLLAQQNTDGGFPWFEEDVSDTGDTSVAIQTLIVLGEDPKSSKAIAKAFEYIKSMQKEDGGVCAGEYMGTDSTSSSNAWVLQAFVAAGKNPTDDYWTVDGVNPLRHLLNNQAPDGSFYWKNEISSSTVKMTSAAIMALKEKSHPVVVNRYREQAVNKQRFIDLPVTYWAYDEVEDLVDNNVLSGYTDGSFKPDKLVSRAEFTRFLIYGVNKQNLKYSSHLQFKDVPNDHWAYDLIRIGIKQKYMSGRSINEFDPNGKIIRSRTGLYVG